MSISASTGENAQDREPLGGLRFANLTPDMAAQCAELEHLAFPNTDPAYLFTEEDVSVYAETFAEGFFVCLDGERVVGQAAGIFRDFDFSMTQHTLLEMAGPHQCGNHDSEGEWYYGTDIVVHPDYRRRGIGGRFYDLRKDLVRTRRKRGIVGGSHMQGYARHRSSLTPDAYLAKVVAGELYDPTVTFQIQHGFSVRGLLANYVVDDDTGGWNALIVWENPDR
ncbi:MAG TPA: GNAT family N-acetyltransferase [Acidimicrobiia bacterium]|nr:GNAT family N-acetyltransferase [Acidimicrobiia bacterium]